jgi:hypothetical protein
LVTPGAWVYQRIGGMKDAPIKFAPLDDKAPAETRSGFEREFEAYQKWLEPLVDVFRNCTRGIILVDVLEILRGGQNRYVERLAGCGESLSAEPGVGGEAGGAREGELSPGTVGLAAWPRGPLGHRAVRAHVAASRVRIRTKL